VCIWTSWVLAMLILGHFKAHLRFVQVWQGFELVLIVCIGAVVATGAEVKPFELAHLGLAEKTRAWSAGLLDTCHLTLVCGLSQLTVSAPLGI